MVYTPLQVTSSGDIQQERREAITPSPAAEFVARFTQGKIAGSTVRQFVINQAEEESARSKDPQVLSAEEANTLYGVENLLEFQGNITRGEARLKQFRVLRDQDKEAFIAKAAASEGFPSKVGNLFIALGSMAASPETFVPYTKLLGLRNIAGFTKLGAVGKGIVRGAVDGVAGNVAAIPASISNFDDIGQDYTWQDGVIDAGAGAVFGGLLGGAGTGIKARSVLGKRAKRVATYDAEKALMKEFNNLDAQRNAFKQQMTPEAAAGLDTYLNAVDNPDMDMVRAIGKLGNTYASDLDKAPHFLINDVLLRTNFDNLEDDALRGLIEVTGNSRLIPDSLSLDLPRAKSLYSSGKAAELPEALSNIFSKFEKQAIANEPVDKILYYKIPGYGDRIHQKLTSVAIKESKDSLRGTLDDYSRRLAINKGGTTDPQGNPIFIRNQQEKALDSLKFLEKLGESVDKKLKNALSNLETLDPYEKYSTFTEKQKTGAGKKNKPANITIKEFTESIGELSELASYKDLVSEITGKTFRENGILSEDQAFALFKELDELHRVTREIKDPNQVLNLMKEFQIDLKKADSGIDLSLEKYLKKMNSFKTFLDKNPDIRRMSITDLAQLDPKTRSKVVELMRYLQQANPNEAQMRGFLRGDKVAIEEIFEAAKLNKELKDTLTEAQALEILEKGIRNPPPDLLPNTSPLGDANAKFTEDLRASTDYIKEKTEEFKLDLDEEDIARVEELSAKEDNTFRKIAKGAKEALECFLGN